MDRDTFTHPTELGNTKKSISDDMGEPIQFWIRANGHCRECDYWYNYTYRHNDIFDLTKNWKNAELEKPRRKSEQDIRFWITQKHCKNCSAAASDFANYNDIFRIGQRLRFQERRYQRRLMALRAYSGEVPKCECCGIEPVEFLCLDHIEGNGNKHRKSIIGNKDLSEWVIKNGFPPGFRVLCFNCNEAIRFDRECPHKRGM